MKELVLCFDFGGATRTVRGPCHYIRKLSCNLTARQKK